MILPIEIINKILQYSDNIYAYFAFGLNDTKILNHIIVQSNGTISMLKKAIEGSHTKILDWILNNKEHISSKIILSHTIYAKTATIVDYILKRISCTSYDICYMQILYLKHNRFDLFKHLNSIYPIPYFYLITIQPFSFLDKKMSALNFLEDKPNAVIFPSIEETRNAISQPELSVNSNDINQLMVYKKKNKLYISQLAQDLIEALYLLIIQNKHYNELKENEKWIVNDYLKIIASFYSYDPWNYRPWKRDDNGWYIMFNSLIVFFIKNKMYDILNKIDNLRQCLDSDINRSLFLCKGIKLTVKDIESLNEEYQTILEKEYCILNGKTYNPNNNNTICQQKHNYLKANQEMDIDIFFGSIINQQLPVLKKYFNSDIYNFETFLYYYLDRVTDINIMIDHTISTNFKEFFLAICQFPISSIFHYSQDSKLYIYELIQNMITNCLKCCNYDALNSIIDNILYKYNISRYNFECCINDAFYSNCSYEVIKIIKHFISKLYNNQVIKQNGKNIQNQDDDINYDDFESFENDDDEDELFGDAPYNLKLTLGCVNETIMVHNYHLSQLNIFKKYEDIIWPLIIGQHHWLNDSADLMSIISHLLLKVSIENDLYDQYLSFILDIYKENPNDTLTKSGRTELLQKIITCSEKKSFLYLSDINPNNIVYLADKLDVNKYKFYSFLYIRFHNSNPFLTFKKMFQSNSSKNTNINETSLFNKHNYPLSSIECQQFIEKNKGNNSSVDREIDSINIHNRGQLESNKRQAQPYNTKLIKSDNSIDFIESNNISKNLYASTSKLSEQHGIPSKSINYNKTIKTYLNNKKYRNINTYEFKEIFKESSEWKELLMPINYSYSSINDSNIKNSNNYSYNNSSKECNKNYSMLDLFSLIYDI
ncbi:hypothetical protein BCR36DRAFT_12898 [Piromyces finnis]|uniref:Uncharacterized protein n=1 Tax=Piromyces finnis TaxID=1754191 RepID=A0A1Y1VGL6_9FUNG|nr:hypothetical protein BCR36DRAFT_12898 [Piromyces finnis]|eukprot:ORX54851.1 hypothetical protein BCR36DRAFT_12898 [Piromyces finnis]